MTTLTTVGDLANQVHRALKGSRREQFSTLNGAITSTATSVVLHAPYTGITVGSHLCIGTEILYVTDATSAPTFTVRRGLFSTDAAAHLDNDAVEVDWRWFTADVVDALTDEIRSWPDEIFTVDQTDVGVGSSTAVDISLFGFRYILTVRRTISGSDRWISEPSNLYRIDTNLPASSFPSGNALYLPNTRAGTGTVRVEYAADFNVDDIATTTPLQQVGLTNTLYDCAKYGACWRLLTDREAQRSAVESQADPQEPADVKEGSAVNMGGYYLRLRNQRLAEESRRLRSKYPYRFG